MRLTAPGFALRMAGREIRAAPWRLLLLTGSVAIGVAALVAITGFTDNLRTSVRDQARALLGADLSLSGRRELPPSAERVLDSLRARGAAVARVTSFGGMAYVPRTSGARLVQVAAVEAGYPFYGEITTAPAAAWRGLQDGGRVVVDPALLTALDARVGDTLSLGEARLVITGTVVSGPANVGFRSALGPRIYLASRDVAATRLIGFGSRVEYEAFVRLPPSLSPERLAARYRPLLRPDRVTVRIVSEDQRDLNETLGRLTGYLGLVGLIALLLGGIGVASGVVVFIRQRLDTIAVLRCLGASAGLVLAVYVVEAAIMGLAGSMLGAGLGLLAQRLLPALLQDLLPVDVPTSVSPVAIVVGVGAGLWVALVFALIPLLAVRRVPPLAALRREVEPERRRLDPWRLAAVALLAFSMVALAAWQVGSWRQGAAFSGGVAAALLVLWAAAWGLIRAARRWLPSRWPYLWRQGVANLHRPYNQTTTVVVAIGFGAFLLGTLFLTQYNLLRTLRLNGGPERPNLVLFDIQPDQRAAVDRELAAGGYRSLGPVPIVPMRIQSLKGRSVTALGSDPAEPGSRADASGEGAGREGAGREGAGREGASGEGASGDDKSAKGAGREAASREDASREGASREGASRQGASGDGTGRGRAGADRGGPGPGNWAVRREYRSTYRDTLVASERIVAGRWWSRGAKPVEISMERDVAGELGLTVGDEVVWDVQGVPLATRIASLRQVDWARFEPNFFVVFAPGALESAPQSLVTLTRVPDPATRGALQRRIAERLPNVTTLDLSSLQATLERLVDRVVLAIRFMALFTLAAGTLVLVGALATSRFQRVREGALLRTLGATRAQLLRIVLSEYLALGGMAATVALVLSGLASWALARFVFDGGFAIPAALFAALGAAVVALTVGVGLANSRDVLRRPPLEVLRAE